MSVFEAVIGWLAPPTCIGCEAEGSSLCPACAASEILPFGERCYNCGAISSCGRTCPHCRRSGTPRAVWVVTDYADLAKNLMQRYKFGHSRVAANDIAQLMIETFEVYNQQSDLEAANYLVVAVPTATGRVRERGFDHARLLAKKVAAGLELEFCPALIRLGQSRQVGAKRSARLAQQADSYIVRAPQRVKARNILLVDDVVTTGATLQAATRALRQAGARHVDALVLAKKL